MAVCAFLVVDNVSLVINNKRAEEKEIEFPLQYVQLLAHKGQSFQLPHNRDKRIEGPHMVAMVAL